MATVISSKKDYKTKRFGTVKTFNLSYYSNFNKLKSLISLLQK